MQRTGAQIVWECLVKEGVETVFGYPGGAILPTYDAMLDYPVRHVLVRHEQGAAHMADGVARASGRVGVAIATSGPGATNLTTGIATAMLDSLGLCIFVAFAVLDIPDAFDAIGEMMTAHTGKTWGADELMQLGKETLTMERLYNEAAGFTAADDRLPAFFYEDKLPPHDVVFTVSDADLDSVYSFVPETAAAMGIGKPGS